MSDTLKAVNDLQREAHGLLRDLEKALIQAHLRRSGPANAARPFDTRFRALARKLEAEGQGDPQVRAYVAKLQTWVEGQRSAMLAEAERAYRDGQKEPDSFGGGSGKPVGESLAHGPGEDGKLLPSTVDKTLREAVDSIFSLPRIPGDLKMQIAAALSAWIQKQSAQQEAFYAAQSALCATAEFIHRKLTLKDELEHTRDALRRNKEISPLQAREASQRVGELGKQCKELEALVERWIQEGCARVDGAPRLNQRLILDPVRSFLGNQERSAGISLKPNKATLELGTRLKVVDPAQPDATKASLASLCGTF